MNGILGIAIPTYKREEEIKKLLASIPNHLNIVISDNGGYLPESFQKSYPNALIKKIIPVVPIFRNWNAAAFAIKNEWLVIPGDDDIYYPESFSIVESYLKKYADMDVIIFGHNTIDSAGCVITSWRPALESFIAPEGFLKFRYGIDARVPSIFIKTTLFKELGGFDEGFNMVADSDFIQRAALIGNVQFIPEVISGYRIWDGGLTHNKIASAEWMKEIDRWCHRISSFCKERNIHIYSKSIHDEIYARNLLGGLIGAKKSLGYIAGWAHLLRCRYPFRALVRTQIRIWYRLVKP